MVGYLVEKCLNASKKNRPQISFLHVSMGSDRQPTLLMVFASDLMIRAFFSHSGQME